MSERIINYIKENLEKDRSLVRLLKNHAVDKQDFELAAEIRQIELDKFKVIKPSSELYKRVELIKNALLASGIDCNNEAAYGILSIMDFCKTNELGQFSIKDGSEVKAKAKELFS